MRIGTWNVANRPWTDGHRDLIAGQNCDVWLLTEMNSRWLGPCNNLNGLPQFRCHPSSEVMSRQQHWAVILSRYPFDECLDDPHPASAAAVIEGILFCASILPWRGSGGEHPWAGDSHAARTERAISELLKNLPVGNLVWGGDWNHSLLGSEVAGSLAGRSYVLQAVSRLNLQVPIMTLT